MNTIFTHIVRPCFRLYVRTSIHTYVLTVQDLAKQNKFQLKIVISTEEIVGLAEWIIDNTTCLVTVLSFSIGLKICKYASKFSFLLFNVRLVWCLFCHVIQILTQEKKSCVKRRG